MTRAALLLVSIALAACASAAEPRRSGYDDMTPQLQAMQRDDAANPAMLWVEDGRAIWQRECSACHGDAALGMRGVAARYPAFDATLGRPVTLSERLNHRLTPTLAPESDALLGLAAYVALQSRGLPIVPPADARLQPFRERGRQLYERRMGQLDLACAQCHDNHAGQRLGGSTIPQAHPTGYPQYRLEWQGLASLQRRLRSCITGVRAEPYAYGSLELVELELHLMQRAAGMNLDAPAVRP